MKSYKHQEKELEVARTMRDRGLLWDAGTGKSKGVIDIIRDKYNTNKRLMPTLIVTPLVTVYNWKEEFLKFSKIKKEYILVVDCNGAKRNKLIEKHLQLFPQGIIIVNHEALQTAKVFELLKAWTPDIVICDESHRIKNPKAIRSKKTIAIGDRADHRYILTGTFILNNVQDVFNQFRFLDKGETFGTNFFIFQRKYMIDKNAGMPKYSHFPNWVANDAMYDELTEKIYRKCSRVVKSECLDLPPMVTTRRDVKLGKDQAASYKQMKEQFITFVKNELEDKTEAVVATLAMTKAMRLMQIASGFAKTEDGNIVEFKDNPRIKAVEDLLEELTPDNKVILWCSYKHNYTQLGKLCTKMGIKHVFLTGEMSIKQKQESMVQFREDDDTKVIIANRRAGGIGINLVEASYSIVYSRNFSLEEEIQSEARNYRGGSQMHEKITKINLCAKDTIDELVLKALSDKQAVSDTILDWTEEL